MTIWSVYIFIIWENVNYLILKIFIQIKKLKINEFENDQHGELDNKFDPLNKVVQDKGKSVSTVIDHLDYSDVGNSSYAPRYWK